MTPYYEDDACTIYHGDARLLAALMDADVVITDPPCPYNGMECGGYE